jgi:type IV secretory pathway ATPase VirB11/archaellum biosynthesis ATPase
MNVANTNHPDLTALTEREVAQLAQRLEEDDYPSPFEALQDWHLLRALAFQRPEVVEPYLYLLDLEAFDES